MRDRGRLRQHVAGTLSLLIWGTRSPVLAEPLVQGTHLELHGGGNERRDRARTATCGREKVTVPAFPAGVTAAKVESVVTQAGALGDPFGSGLRTVWWVYGVGPVKIIFRHAGGETSESRPADHEPRPAGAARRTPTCCR